MNKRKHIIKGQFIMRPVEMLKSPAMAALSLVGHRILNVMEIEHCAQGGKNNGALVVTHADCKTVARIGHNNIGPGLREVEALGFVVRTQHGVAGNADHRKPNMFRLAYLPAFGAEPTNEWAAIATLEEADAIAAEARRKKPERYRITTGTRKRSCSPKKQKSVPGSGTKIGDFQSPDRGVRDKNSQSPVRGVLSRYLAISRGAVPQLEGAEEPRRPWSAPVLIELPPDDAARVRAALAGDDG